MVRYSSRIAFDLPGNRLSEVLARKSAAGERILDLSASNPTIAHLHYPQKAILTALQDARALEYRPAPQGWLGSREAISGYYGNKVAPERILLTASTSEAYSYAFKLLCDAGDEVLVPRPSYPLFEYLAALECAKVVQYPLLRPWLDRRYPSFGRSHHLAYPRRSFRESGQSDRFLLEEIGVRLHRRVMPAALTGDNIGRVFADYSFEDNPERISTLADTSDVLTLCLSGLSKVSGLPQLKLGWIVVAGPKRVAEEALHRLELIADTFLSVASPVQHATHSLLAIGETVREQIRARTKQNLKLLRQQTLQTSMRVLQIEAGWFAPVQVPQIFSEEEWALQLLEQHNVLVQPGFFYDFDSEAFLILSLLTPEADFKEGLAALRTIA